MANIFLIVEGATEERFYREQLQAYYVDGHGNYQHYFTVVQMPSLRNPDTRTQRGGAISFDRSLRHVNRFLHQASHCELVILLYDYYGLNGSFLEDVKDSGLPLNERIAAIEARFEQAVGSDRFRFRLQLHEFEAYLYSNTQIVAAHFNQPAGKTELDAHLSAAGNDPEMINDSYDTKPSNRLKTVFPGYGKTADGLVIVGKIGVERIRERCARFGGVLALIESVEII